MTGFINRRQTERYKVKLEVNIHRLSDSTVFITSTRDLSRGGMCLNIKEPLEKNENIKLKMSLILSSEAQSEPLDVNAKVAWCSEDDNGEYQIGVYFISLKQETHNHINTFIEFIENELPLF